MTATGKARNFRRVVILVAVAVGAGIAVEAMRQSSTEGPKLTDTNSILPIPGEVILQPQPDTAHLTEIVHGGDESEERRRQTISVKFPDGDQLSFELRPSPVAITLPTAPAIEEYANLSQAAKNGDGKAAYVLSGVLAGCGDTHRTGEDVESAIDQMYQTQTVPMPGSKSPAQILANSDMSQLEAALREAQSRCNGLSESQIAEADDWMRMAADLGDLSASMVLGQRLLGMRDPGAKKYLERVWRAGDLAAAFHLSRFYSDVSPEQTDLVTGYAYKYVHDLIVDERISAGENSQRFHGSSESIRNATFRLSPVEQDEAINLAKKLLRQNTNCCLARGVGL